MEISTKELYSDNFDYNHNYYSFVIGHAHVILLQATLTPHPLPCPTTLNFLPTITSYVITSYTNYILLQWSIWFFDFIIIATLQ